MLQDLLLDYRREEWPNVVRRHLVEGHPDDTLEWNIVEDRALFLLDHSESLVFDCEWPNFEVINGLRTCDSSSSKLDCELQHRLRILKSRRGRVIEHVPARQPAS